MGFRHLNADEEQRWFLFFSWWHFIGWLNLIEYFSFKRKFKGPGWYDLHCGSVPKFLKKEFNQTGWKIKVIDHMPVSKTDGTYTVKFEGNGKEGLLNVDYFTADHFRTSITIRK
ncbi:MAG: hypothetical protein AAF546_12485 [Verrucomicrobiota bacterium]